MTLCVRYITLALLALLVGCGSADSPSASASAKVQTVGTADSNVVSTVSEMGLGDIYYVAFDTDNAASVDFSNSDSSSKYTLVVQSTDSTSSNITIAKSVASPEGLDAMLREQERSLAENEQPVEPSLSFGKSLAKAAIGDSRSFKVLSSITSTSSYTTVSATVKCVEEHIIVYLDDDVPSSSLDDTDIATLCDQFESSAAAEEAILGEPSDVNGDGHVVTLITLAVNRLGASGGGIVTGYFYANDLYSGSNSNQMEIIYILAPDPGGDDGTPISKAFAMSNLMPAVVPHELQHAISYNQHVLTNGGSTEESWLNEALSHFTEDLVGFGQENPSRVEIFLEAPESTQLAPLSSPDLAERGAEYLFLRFLYERSGSPNTFLGNLENTTLTGMNNVEGAFAGTDAGFDEWEEFMRRWAIAIALTNTGISSTAQYQFNDRTLNSTTGKWQGICLVCDADDERGTVLVGPYAPELTDTTLFLSGTATAFYTISSAPTTTLTLQGTASASLQGALIRIE